MAHDMCFDDGSTLQALHEQVYGGPGVAAIEPAAAGLAALAPWISGSSDRLCDALRRGGVSWSGSAAEASTAAFGQAGHWADTTGQTAHTAAAGVQAFADSFARMKPRIVPPAPVPALSVWDGVLGVLSPSATDHARIVRDNANATETALAAYTAHETSTDDTIGQLPTTSPAPPITAPSTPTNPATLSSRADTIGRGSVARAGEAGGRAPAAPGRAGHTGGGTATTGRPDTAPAGRPDTALAPVARSGGTTPSGWTPPAPRAPMDPTTPTGGVSGGGVSGGGVPGARPSGGLVPPVGGSGGGDGLGVPPVSRRPDAGPLYRAPRGAGLTAVPVERVLSRAPDPAPDALSGQLGDSAGGRNTTPGGPGRPPLPPLGGGGGWYRDRRRRTRTDADMISPYEDLFGADDLTDGLAPTVLGLDQPPP
jgi:hypothetical protein